MAQTFIGRIREFFSSTGNQLSRRLRVFSGRIRTSLFKPTHDWSRADYDWYRRAYYCKVRGLELSGLFIKPLINKLAAWTLSQPPNWKLESDSSAEALSEWWAENHSDVLKAWRSALKQGDSFIVVNGDLTLTVVQPDLVEPMVSDGDYAEIVGWRISQVIPHPTRAADRMTVIDEYTATVRVHVVEVNGKELERTVYPNLIGRTPVVHIPNSPDVGEVFGHPEAEPLVEILQRYGLVLESGVEGNEAQGRPTPVLKFETVEAHDAFWERYGETQRHELPDGTVEEESVLSIDLKQLLTVAGADFKYESPGSFIADTEKLLGLMFYLILEHTELPEFVFGNAISSSKASAETQMPVFVRYIEMRRGEMTSWLTQLAEIALALLALVDPTVRFETPALQWDQLADDDGRLLLETLRWAYAEGLLDDRTALMLAPIDIENIDAVLEQARLEREERFPDIGEPGDDAIARLFQGEIQKQEQEETA